MTFGEGLEVHTIDFELFRHTTVANKRKLGFSHGKVTLRYVIYHE
jgi:hypothetical protein